MQEQPQHYELTLLISGALAEDQHQAILNEVKSLMGKNGAQITGEVMLGRRKLAYAIKNLKHGFYFTLEFNLPAGNLKPVEKALKLNHNIIRFLTVKKREKTAKEIAREEKIKASKVKEQLRQQKEAQQLETKPRETIAKPKVSLEDLDKKLDELLDEKVI